MLRKRKGSEASDGLDEPSVSNCKFRSSLTIIGSHFSLEACSRQRKKKCKEQVVVEGISVSSFKNRLTGIVTAPPCGTSSTNHGGARGLKRKIGCIDAATKMGRKKKIDQEYILGDQIGTGKFGSVRLCQSKINAVEFACKTLRKGEETVHREVEIMQHLSGHPGVVTLKAVYEDSDCFHLVMELCSGGRLIDQIVKEGPCSEPLAANIIKDLILVVKYCHEMGVVHRDIKPENILLTASGKLKLADFGLATRITDGQSLSGVAGSPGYVAPEVLVGDYSEKVDIWSAGVLLHVLLVHTHPFQGDSLEAVFEAVKTVKLEFNSAIWEPISAMARDLMGRMLTRNVSERITAEELLCHPWITFNTEQVLKAVPIKSKTRNLVGGTLCQHIYRGHLKRSSVTSALLTDNSDLTVSTDSLSRYPEDQDDSCELVDALAVAISRITISEPKRSRLCVPSNSLQRDCSANLKTSNLCAAF